MEPTTTAAPENISAPTGKFPGWAVALVVFLFFITIGIIAVIGLILFQAANAPVTTTPPAALLPENVMPSTPPADPTANWKTYNNEELGISFKHPTDWPVRFVETAPGEGTAGSSTSNLRIGDIMFIKRGQAKEDFYGSDGFENVVEDPAEMPPVVINGTIYEFIKTSFFGGEGMEESGCVEGTSQHFYYFELNNEVVVIQSTESFSCDIYGEQRTTKTKIEDLEIARLIAESISFSE